MKIFIDVDNTILEQTGFYSYETESRIHRSIGKYPKDNQHAIKTMYETSICHDPEVIRSMFKHEEVYILTKFPHEDYEYYKQVRVAQILGVSREELLGFTDSKGRPKYICVEQTGSKVEDVKKIFNVESMEGFILVDDYSQNIIEWEQNGGIGFKYFNEYNSPKHPTNGISISNFKIFEVALANKELNTIMLVGSNKYKLELISNGLLEDEAKYQVIENTKIVQDDLQKSLDVNHFPETHKYSYLNFLIEYYKFRNHLDDTYWTEKIQSQINPEQFTIIKSTFEPSEASLRQLTSLQNGAFLKINILSEDNLMPSNIYDLYITIGEKRYVESVTHLFGRITAVLNSLIKVNH